MSLYTWRDKIKMFFCVHHWKILTVDQQTYAPRMRQCGKCFKLQRAKRLFTTVEWE